MKEKVFERIFINIDFSKTMLNEMEELITVKFLDDETKRSLMFDLDKYKRSFEEAQLKIQLGYFKHERNSTTSVKNILENFYSKLNSYVASNKINENLEIIPVLILRDSQSL